MILRTVRGTVAKSTTVVTAIAGAREADRDIAVEDIGSLSDLRLLGP